MNKGKNYEQPECHFIDVAARSVLCASGEFISSNPFGNSTEEEW